MVYGWCKGILQPQQSLKHRVDITLITSWDIQNYGYRGFYKEGGKGKKNKALRGRTCGYAGSVLAGPDRDFYGQCP